MDKNELKHGCESPMYSDWICTVPGCPNSLQLSETGEALLDKIVEDAKFWPEGEI